MDQELTVHLTEDADLLRQADQLLWEVLWKPLDMPRDRRHQFTPPGPEYTFVAERGGRVEGVLVGALGEQGQAELRHLAVDASCQKSGIGGKLVAAYVEFCTERGFPSIVVTVRANSQAFYEKHGFAPIDGQELSFPIFEAHGIRFRKLSLALPAGRGAGGA